MGAFLTGVLARNVANSNLATNLKDYVKDTAFQPLVFEQLKAIVLTLLLAVIGTTVIAFAVKAVIGLRPDEEVESNGLDIEEHGEEGYHSDVFGSSRPASGGAAQSAPSAIPAPAVRRAATT